MHTRTRHAPTRTAHDHAPPLTPRRCAADVHDLLHGESADASDEADAANEADEADDADDAAEHRAAERRHRVQRLHTPLERLRRPRPSARRARVVARFGGGLPAEVEALLPSSALAQRSTVAEQWRALRACYPSDAAAVAALGKAPALCYPWACSPSTIRGSYAVIVEACGKEAALDVITKNPGALGNDPTRLRRSSASEIEGAAAAAAAIGGLFGALRAALPALGALGALAAAAAALAPAGAAPLVELGAVARPLAGAVGATAFLSTAAVAVYVGSRR
jgi:hypothetical protein